MPAQGCGRPERVPRTTRGTTRHPLQAVIARHSGGGTNNSAPANVRRPGLALPEQSELLYAFVTLVA